MDESFSKDKPKEIKENESLNEEKILQKKKIAGSVPMPGMTEILNKKNENKSKPVISKY